MRTAVATAPSSSLRIPLPVAVLAFCLLWSSAYAVAKLAIIDCPPLILLTARFLLAGVLMLGLAAITGVSLKMSRRDLILFAALGVANQAAYLGIGYVGLKTVSAGLSALIISANPVLTAVLAAIFLDEQMTARKVAGLLLGIAGVAFVVQGRLAGGVDHFDGIVYTLIALVALVIGTILFKKFAPGGGLWVGNGVQSLSAGLVLLPFAFATESIGDVVPTWRLLWSLAFLVLLVSVFAYLLWFHLLRVSGATAASSYHFLMPPFGMLFGWLLLGEHVSPIDMIGIVPVALGIWLVTRPAVEKV